MFLVGVGGRDEFNWEVGFGLGSLECWDPWDLDRKLSAGEGGTGLAGDTILSFGSGSLHGGGGRGGRSLNKN